MLKKNKNFKNVAHGGLIDFILGITHLITSHHMAFGVKHHGATT